MNSTPFSWQNEIKGKLRTKSIGDDFILLENFANVPKFLYPFKLEMTVALLCTKGMIRGAIDMHSYDLHAPFSIIVISGQVLHHEYVSSDFSGFCLVLSDSFALEFFPYFNMLFGKLSVRSFFYNIGNKQRLVNLRQKFQCKAVGQY